MGLKFFLGQQIERRRRRIVAEQPLGRAQKRALAVAAATIAKPKALLGRVWRQPIAGTALQVVAELVIVLGDTIEKLKPHRTRPAHWRHRRDLGEIILAAMLAQRPMRSAVVR